MSYKVKLEVFEGPFDLLVYLVESSEMNIYDIRISEITDKYLEYIKEYERRDIDVSAEFLVLAATLIEIKSKMLLPGIKKDSEEIMEDPRKDLVDRLLEYKKFKEASEYLEKIADRTALRMYKPMEDLSEYDNRGAFDIMVLDPDKFIAVFRAFMEKRRKLEEIQQRYGPARTLEKRVSVKDRARAIKRLVAARGRFSFADAMEDCASSYEIAATFLAMLEMAKAGSIIISQRSNFGEIIIEGRGN